MPGSKKTVEAVAMGARLLALREELGLSRAEAGNRLGLTEEGYGHYERGYSRIVSTDLPRFANALGVSNRALLMRLGLLELTAEVDNAEMADVDLGRRLAPIVESWTDADERGRTDAATVLDTVARLLRRAPHQSRSNAKKSNRSAISRSVQHRPVLALAR